MSEHADHPEFTLFGSVGTGLVTRAAHGDEQARTELVERCRDQVQGWCCSILRDSERAEDATQDALVLLWRHIGALHEPRAFSSWLYRLTLNACRRQLQRQAEANTSGAESRTDDPKREPTWRTPTPEDIAIARLELEQLLGRLRSSDREMLAMKYSRKMSAKEIGQELRISEGAVRTRLYSILQWLRRRNGPRKPSK